MSRSLITHALSCYDYVTAEFLCEQLMHSDDDNDPDTRYNQVFARVKLGEILLQQNRMKRAYEALQDLFISKTEQQVPRAQKTPLDTLEEHGVFLLAKVCVSLNMFHQAEIALLQSRNKSHQFFMDKANSVGGCDPQNAPVGGANGFYLLGDICARTNRSKLAIMYFRQALTLDPYNWASFKQLCDMGAEVNVRDYFHGDIDHLYPEVGTFLIPKNPSFPKSSPPNTDSKSISDTPLPMMTPFADDSVISTNNKGTNAGGNKRLQFLDESSHVPTRRGGLNYDETPVANNTNSNRRLDDSNDNTADWAPRRGKGKRSLTDDDFDLPAVSFGHEENWACNQCTFLNQLSSPVCEMCGNVAPVEDSMMGEDLLTSSIHKSSSDTFSTSSAFLFKQHTPRGAGEQKHENNIIVKSMNMSELLCTLASAYYLASQYKSKQAIEELQRLSIAHYNTGWTLSLLGRCYFELVDYNKAVYAYEQARRLAPYHVAGVEYHSTSLWHLKKEVQLSFLGQELVALDKMAPETWIVVGNCFSLQKEHETSLKFFRRAYQLDPQCAYAYTLCGHELSANEDFEKAISNYRLALVADERHYNAWYGMGNIYYRQEKYDLAQYHFERALGINQQSSVLFCYLGMVLNTMEKYNKALELLATANSLEPGNPLAKFQMANVYINMNEFERALEQLESVLLLAPREAAVHFLMGKIHIKLNNPEQALMRYMTALDLDPKDKNAIKSAIEKLHNLEEDDEELLDDSLLDNELSEEDDMSDGMEYE